MSWSAEIALQAGIVDENVDGAEFLHHPREHRGDRDLPRRHRPCTQRPFRAGLPDLLDHGFGGGVSLDVIDHDIGASLRPMRSPPPCRCPNWRRSPAPSGRSAAYGRRQAARSIRLARFGLNSWGSLRFGGCRYVVFDESTDHKLTGSDNAGPADNARQYRMCPASADLFCRSGQRHRSQVAAGGIGNSPNSEKGRALGPAFSRFAHARRSRDISRWCRSPFR